MLYVTVKDDPTTTNGTVSFRMEGEIYTVGGSGEWRRIGEVPYPLRARESEAYLNGVLHWLMTDQDIGIETCEFIGAFDVASEEFRSLPPPQTQFSSESRTSLRRLNLNLGVLGDELCIFDNYFSDRMEIWMMKDYEVQSSWTKQYVIKRPRSLEVQQDTRVYFKPLALKLTHNGEILMLYDSVAIVCYNPVGKFFYHLGLFGFPVATNVCKAIVHVGSLVSLRNVAANEGENSNTAVDKSVKRVDVVDESAESRKISDIPYGTWDTILYPIPTHEPKLDICKWLAEKGVALHIGRLDRPAVPR
ncbi:F-box protein At3g07870-like isoform X2 [Camellia sinensis]|uniref:F-box protein At3g07870-like isoform X2 n=1 Tax=Camellia sinensis TaxID=4442 RepID=UPI001036744B|nr:F-box protein At3g07870-like isoform X2 [Camellia sinensis]